MKKRITNNGRSINKYRNKIFVECPNCLSIAIITVQGIEYDFPIQHDEIKRVICLKCTFNKEKKNVIWKGEITGSFKRPCGKCGYQWIEKRIYRTKYSPKIPMTAKVKCPVCNNETEENLQWNISYSATQGIDPYFGLPLWLKFKIGSHELWAYNENHINDLVDYIDADLRERVSYPTKWAMVTRLPKWVKEAKNREIITKGLKRLKKKLETDLSTFA
ncbi:hypothetical protein [Leptospira barantonii]|uniref:Uncharacterized protein n=1 Tax=Leptospira barantonii TaxID=2023184 RepID=A0ABX4NKP7_9LEPT|nr:hypothetical protein [Leptospira barantonii]PJZ57407.1 hypothetical protein CH367_10930 [Leptospira barantonii]